MYSATLLTVFVGRFLVNSVNSETPHCTGPTPFCDNIIATSATIEEAWATYGASNAALTNSVLLSVISSLTAEQDNDFQECMIRIHNQFNGASVSSTDPLCQTALEEPTETDAIDYYRDRFFYRVVLDFVKGVVTTMITVRDSGADCNLAECSYLITDSFPKVAMESSREEEETKVDKEADEKELNTLLEKLKELNSEKVKRARSKQTKNTDINEELALESTQEKQEERNEEERDLILMLQMLKQLDSNKVEKPRIKEKRSKLESRAKKEKRARAK